MNPLQARYSERVESVEVQRSAREPIGGGEYADVFAPLRTIRAKVREESGAERLRAARVTEEQAVLVTARYADAHDITPADRFVLDGDVLAIHAARRIGRRDGVEFTCTRIEAP